MSYAEFIDLLMLAVFVLTLVAILPSDRARIVTLAVLLLCFAVGAIKHIPDGKNEIRVIRCKWSELGK